MSYNAYYANYAYYYAYYAYYNAYYASTGCHTMRTHCFRIGSEHRTLKSLKSRRALVAALRIQE